MKLHIHTFTAFITESHLYIKGRILRDGPIMDNDRRGVLSSLLVVALRSMSREIENVQISIDLDGHHYQTITDCEGYFEVFEEISHLDFGLLYASITAEYMDVKTADIHLVKKQVFTASIGVISDIDDTIMMTGVKSFFKSRVLINTLFLNPFRRKPIKGAAVAFRKLAGRSSTDHGPIIYLSNSPWNLYEYLTSFLKHNEFPEGILILRDMGIQLLKSRTIAQRNKFVEIERILMAFSNQKFILVGDTGELDFDIYIAIKERYPEQITQIILNKAGNKKKESMITEYAKEYQYVSIVAGYTDI